MQSAAAAPSTTPPETVEITKLPPSSDALQQGRAIEGVIVERTGVDQFALQTREGIVTLRTTLPLEPGATIQLKVLTETTPALAAIVTNSAPPTPVSPAVDPALIPGDAIRGAQGPVFLATVTGPAVSAINAAATLSPSSLTGADNARETSGLSSQASSPKGPTGPLSGRLGGAPLGSRAPLRILHARPPGAAPPNTSSTPPKQGTFEGIVTSSAANGQVTVRSPLGELTFTPDRTLPLGANLVLQLTGDIQAPNGGAASPQALAFAPYWATLQSLLGAGKSALGANAAVSDAIPKPNTALTASAMFFMSALRMGDLRQWLGPNAMPLLEQSGLLGQMADEFASMQRLTLESNNNDWRLFLIPFLSDGLLQQLKLYIHDNKEGSDENPEDAAQHFVIEVEFQHLGPFQFEGLTRSKQFDLIIRTEREVPDTMQNGIKTVFTDTISALGLTGLLTFKMAEPFLSQPRESASPNGPEILI